jgi:hypothetical protein
MHPRHSRHLAATGDDQLWCELVKVLENWIELSVKHLHLSHALMRLYCPVWVCR